MLYFFINLGCQKESQLSNEEKEERKKERLGKSLPRKKIENYDNGFLLVIDFLSYLSTLSFQTKKNSAID